MPALAVSRADAAALRAARPCCCAAATRRSAGAVAIFTQGDLIALAEVEAGELRPRRIFNLDGTAAA